MLIRTCLQTLTLSLAKPIITVHMFVQNNLVSKQLTLYDQETSDQYVVDYKVLIV